jgi:hypothetical protein
MRIERSGPKQTKTPPPAHPFQIYNLNEQTHENNQTRDKKHGPEDCLLPGRCDLSV